MLLIKPNTLPLIISAIILFLLFLHHIVDKCKKIKEIHELKYSTIVQKTKAKNLDEQKKNNHSLYDTFVTIKGTNNSAETLLHDLQCNVMEPLLGCPTYKVNAIS